MMIHGFNKTTLLDYPGMVACTVFTGGCNFRCPFCQNGDLVLDPNSQPTIPEDEILNHLKKRKGITRGICITGGEPTLNKDLGEFMEKCKDIGLKVKLDTNGYRPEILKDLCKKGLVDYVAMDIKSSLKEYHRAAGVDIDTEKIKESVQFLLSGDIPFEFRTTVVRELHDREVFNDIADLISGADRYFLQGYEDSDRVIAPGFSAYTEDELKSFIPIFEGRVKSVSIRGF